jgi:hypothetical protein
MYFIKEASGLYEERDRIRFRGKDLPIKVLFSNAQQELERDQGVVKEERRYYNT